MCLNYLYSYLFTYQYRLYLYINTKRTGVCTYKKDVKFSVGPSSVNYSSHENEIRISTTFLYKVLQNK